MARRRSPCAQPGSASDDETENEPCQCRDCFRARARHAELEAAAAVVASARISADAAAARAGATASIEVARVEEIVPVLVPQGSLWCLSIIGDAEGRSCPCRACRDERLRVAEELTAEATLLTEVEAMVAEGAAAAAEVAAEAARLARTPEPSAPAHTTGRLPPVRLQRSRRAQGRRQAGAGRAARLFR